MLGSLLATHTSELPPRFWPLAITYLNIHTHMCQLWRRPLALPPPPAPGVRFTSPWAGVGVGVAMSPLFSMLGWPKERRREGGGFEKGQDIRGSKCFRRRQRETGWSILIPNDVAVGDCGDPTAHTPRVGVQVAPLPPPFCPGRELSFPVQKCSPPSSGGHGVPRRGWLFSPVAGFCSAAPPL